jgi:RNA polymerase sigma-70 factor (ECF subfamily)
VSVSDKTDDDLLRRFIATGDEQTFHELYAAHGGAMYLLAKRLTGGREAEAQDIVQEAWLRVAAGRTAFEGRASVRTWLCGVVVNCSREQYRKAHGAPPSAGELPEPSTPPRDALDLERAIRELPDGFREVLVLHDIYGYTHDEIGAMCGIDPGTSKSQLSRARQRVRERFSEVIP